MLKEVYHHIVINPLPINVVQYMVIMRLLKTYIFNSIFLLIIFMCVTITISKLLLTKLFIYNLIFFIFYHVY